MNEKSAKDTEKTPATDLKTIGGVLKSKREELSYTLEHVSEITKINQTCLRDIEEGKLDRLSRLVFVRGFIRNYAKLLGMDSDWMIEALDQTYAFDKSKSASGKTGFGETTKNRHANAYLFAGLGTLIVAIVGFLYWNSNSNGRILSNAKTIESVQETAGSDSASVGIEDIVTDRAVQLDDAKVESAEEKESMDTIVARRIYPLNLMLVANRSDWIRLAIDNQEATEIRMTKGQKLEWPANEGYNLVMTTGSSATIHLNGEEIEVDSSNKERLFRMKLNKFSLTQLNN